MNHDPECDSILGGLNCSCQARRSEKSMTQELSDEGLRERARQLMRDGFIENDVTVVDAVTSALKQVRRETREEDAKVADLMMLNSKGLISASRVATAIRALEGSGS